MFCDIQGRRFIQCLLPGVICLTAIPAFGQDVIWVGGANNFWHTVSNWDSGRLPTTSDIARIDDDPTTDSVVVLDNNGTFEVEVGGIQVDFGDEIRLNGQDLILATVSNDGYIVVDGANARLTSNLPDLEISGVGTIFLENSSSALTVSGALTIGADQTISGPSGSVTSGLGNLTNHGTIEARSSGAIGNRLRIGSFTAPVVFNNGTIRAADQGNISFTSLTIEGGALEAVNGSRFFLAGRTIRNATFKTDSGTGSVIGEFETFAWENVDLQGFARPVELTYTGDLQNTGLLSILNGFGPNLIIESDVTVTGDGEINFPQAGPNVIGDFSFENNGNTLSGSGTFAPLDMSCTGVRIKPSDDFENNVAMQEMGVFEFRCPTTWKDVNLQIHVGGNTFGSPPATPDAAIVNTYQDLNEFLRDVLSVLYDQVNVFDTLNLTGNVEIELTLVNDFIPAATDFFDVLSADTLLDAQNLTFSFPEVDGVIFDPLILNLPDPTTGTHRDTVRVDIKLLGDVNQDDSVDLLDVAPFVVLITTGIFQVEGDINRDGVVNLLDVTGFVTLITG